MSKKKNPIPDAVIFATGTTIGIIVGTVLATWIVESLRASGQLPGSQVPQSAPLPSGASTSTVPTVQA